MKHTFLILFFSAIHVISIAQNDTDIEIFTSAYITDFKDKIENIINNGQVNFDHSDGEMSSSTSYYYEDKLIKDSFHDFCSDGILMTVIYYNLDNEDCVADIKYYVKGTEKLNMRIVRLKDSVYEKIFKGTKDNIVSKIEYIKELIIKHPSKELS